MKNLLYVLSALILLASCGGSGFLNRKYTKGIYRESVAKSSKVKSNELNKSAIKPEIKPSNQTVVQQSKANTYKSTATAEAPVYAHVNSVKTKNNKAIIRLIKPEVKTKDIEVVLKKIKAEQKISEQLNKSQSSDSDLKLVILVLLALILPPLACYLKEKSTNTWFWVTLILCLLSFSYYIFVFGGLGWLAAVVIAILYVLGAIK